MRINGTMTAAPEGPSTTVIQSMGWTPVMGDSSGLVSQLRHLLTDGYRVILAADTEGSADRLQVVLRDEGLQVTVVPPGYDPDIDKLAPRLIGFGNCKQVLLRLAE